MKVFNNIKIIGDGSAFSIMPKTSFYFDNNKTIYLFECNDDTFEYIKAHYQQFSQYKYWIIYISHLHEDHCNGIANTLYWLRYKYDINIEENVDIVCMDLINMRAYLSLTAPDLTASIISSERLRFETFWTGIITPCEPSSPRDLHTW